MPPTALMLVVVAAFLHAAWNLALKRTAVGGVALVWAASTVATVVLAPLALALHGGSLATLGVEAWIAIGASGLLHVAYYHALQKGYSVADLSIVYPVARGVGPLISALAAIALFGEPASPASLAGLALIVAGTFTIAGGWAIVRGRLTERAVRGLSWGGLTGLLIAAYTLNDGRAVRALGLAPILFDWLVSASRMLLLAPVVARAPAQLRLAVARSWRTAVIVGVLSPASYILVLQAMTIAPISLVAPAREMSMLIAAFLGARLLGEGSLAQRLGGAALIAGGVAGLALGGR